MALALTLASNPTMAQQAVSVGVEVATDERRRGLSWTDGDAAIAGDVRVQTLAGFDAGVRATALRGAERHGGADAVVDLDLGWARDQGALRLEARAIGHLFAGAREGLDYWELGAGAGVLFGPAQLDLLARYAPDQDAIGGDNLYLGGRASAGIPATPYTVRVAAGRSSGDADDPRRAARLRPAGTYWDWSIGVARISGPLTLGLDYTGTDIGDRAAPVSPFAVRRHAGDRLTLRAAVSF